MKWTPEQLAELRRLYPDRTADECARVMGRTVSSIHNAAYLSRLRKSSQFLNSEQSGRIGKLLERGIVYRFKNGHPSWNKGVKGLPLGGHTKFKPGNLPHNHRPIGSERTDTDGILWRKMTDTRCKSDWRAVHVMEWEKANGPLPCGKIVIFADGNRRNFEPSNLLAVTRGELMQRNTVHRYPKEIARLVQLRGVLNRQIRKRERDAKQDRRPA